MKSFVFVALLRISVPSCRMCSYIRCSGERWDKYCCSTPLRLTTCTYSQTHINSYTCTNANTYTYIQTCTYTNIPTYTYTYILILTHAYTCILAHMHTCTNTQTHSQKPRTRIHIHTYTYYGPMHTYMSPTGDNAGVRLVLENMNALTVNYILSLFA
jgi:hypothetical protein